MKFNIKSRKGFTLIELLVVIGILAVLAAIAIPSVAGLIDRANVSSDATNSNEMTNAVERFVSEYELYKQDIASGTIKFGQTSGFDSAQGRVYNVTKVTDRTGIENLEKDSSAGPETEGRAIYRDTKYPVNAETVKVIIENYTKTSSSTFEPKQSDKHFWYSPQCGTIIVATPNSSIKEKNDMIISGTDAKGRELDDDNEVWIDLTISNSVNTNTPNEEIGKIHIEGDYQYAYNVIWCSNCERWSNICDCEWDSSETMVNGWSVRVLDSTKESYGPILNEIEGKPVTSLYSAFENCENLKVAPAIPSSVKIMTWSFAACWNLTTAPQIPNTVTNTSHMFHKCPELLTYSGSTSQNGDFSNYKIPNSLVTASGMFSGCVYITELPDFSTCNNLISLDGAFADCQSLTDLSNFIIPNSVTDMYNAFSGCISITQKPSIPSNVQNTEAEIFFACPQLGYPHH